MPRPARAPLPPYEPPPDGEPLDAVQEVVVEMMADIIVDRIRKRLAAEQAPVELESDEAPRVST